MKTHSLIKFLLVHLALPTLVLSVLIPGRARAESFTIKPDDISLSNHHSGLVGRALTVTIKGRSFDIAYGLGYRIRDFQQQLGSRLLAASLKGEVVTVDLADLLESHFIVAEGDAANSDSEHSDSATPSQLLGLFHFHVDRGPAAVSDVRDPKNVNISGNGPDWRTSQVLSGRSIH